MLFSEWYFICKVVNILLEKITHLPHLKDVSLELQSITRAPCNTQVCNPLQNGNGQWRSLLHALIVTRADVNQSESLFQIDNWSQTFVLRGPELKTSFRLIKILCHKSHIGLVHKCIVLILLQRHFLLVQNICDIYGGHDVESPVGNKALSLLLLCMYAINNLSKENKVKKKKIILWIVIISVSSLTRKHRESMSK